MCIIRVHISVDDTIAVLEDITKNCEYYSSIFDNDFLELIRREHIKYNFTFSLYLFWQNGDASFNLSRCTDAFREEFINNSEWLKLGFHGLDRWNTAKKFSNVQLAEIYNNVCDEINRFAGKECIDTCVRLSEYAASKSQVSLLCCQKYPVNGLYCSEGGAKSYYLDDILAQKVKRKRKIQDKSNKVFFLDTQCRLENIENDSLPALRYRQNEMFTHESFWYENALEFERILELVGQKSKRFSIH